MKIYISYFYNIRFFPQNLLPVSTAVWDPKWFHKGRGNKYGFVDKRGVINGLRIEQLHPSIPEEYVCSPECDHAHPDTCMFIKEYRKQIFALDFNEIMERLDYLTSNAQKYLKLNEEMDVCLIVYEKPDNPCSERQTIIDYFAEHGITVEEWKRQA